VFGSRPRLGKHTKSPLRRHFPSILFTAFLSVIAVAGACLPQAASATQQQVIVKITGTVNSGTDSSGSANVFGSGTNLATLPFTYTLTYVTGVGSTSSTLCGGVPEFSSVRDSGGANPGVSWLSVGSAGKIFQIGGGDGETGNSSCSAQNVALCGGSNKAGYCMQASYGNGFSGTTNIGPAYPGTFAFPATGASWPSSADWTQLMSSTALDSSHTFTFSINQNLDPTTGTVPLQVASGTLAPGSLTVINIPLNQNAETNGNPGNSSGANESGYIAKVTSTGILVDRGGCGVAWTPPNGNCKNNFGHIYEWIPFRSGATGNPDNSGCNICPVHGGPPDPGGFISIGEPINVSTGNMYEEITDYATSGQNPLTFIRSYNSMGNNITVNGTTVTTLATSLGVNWRSEYDAYLQLVYTGVTLTNVYAERPDGRIIPFVLSGSAWVAASSFPITLVQSGSNWTLTDINGTVETYTSSGTVGSLQSVTLRNGYARTMGYTGGLLTSITDSYSRTLTLSYTSGLLQSIGTPDSTTITYGYGTSGGHNVLTSVSYPSTPSTGFTYQYTDATNPTSITNILDGAGVTYATWTYDSQNRATLSKLGGTLGAISTTIAYNANGSVTVTNALGVADTYTFVYLQGVPKVQFISRASTATTAAAGRSFGYDSNGYLHSVSDWNGNVTVFKRNALGLATSVTEAAGYSVARTTTITYDATFPDLPDEIVTDGLTSDFTYDGSGNMLTETGTDTTTTSVPYSTNGQTRETQWTYNATGQILSVQLPRTDVTAETSYTYDTDGALLTVTDAVGNVTTVTSHSGGGYPLTITDPNSVLTTLTYDGGQRLLTSVLTTGAGNLTTTNTYDTAGNLASVEKPDGSELDFDYDAAHRLTTITDLPGNTVNITLDALGDATAVQVEDPTPTVTASHTATFDALGRMLTYVGGMSQTTTLTWDANSNLKTVKNPLLHTTTLTYDQLNRLLTSVDPSPGGTTTITYDKHDRVLTVKNPLNNTTSYVYDGFGDRIQEASPDSGTAVYYFDPDSNLTEQLLAGSLEADMTYDADDRMLTASYPSDTSLNTSLTYDQTGHGDGLGRLTSATDKVGSLSLTYDERGNVTAESRVATGLTTLATAYAFDAGNNVSSITYPSGTIVAYGRNSMGRVTSVTAQPPGAGSPSNVATSITYEPFGPVTGLSYGNGLTGTYVYDNDYRPTSRVDTATSDVLNLAYTYDAADNVKTITDTVNAANGQTLGYDALNRLNSAVSGTGGYGTWSWTWDTDHNVVTQVIAGVTTTFSKTSGTSKLSSWVKSGVTTTVTNTAAGNINLLKNGMTTIETLTYNQANEMATASASGLGSATYTYDLFGRRLLKAPGGGNIILYSLEGISTLLAEDDLHGNTADYIYLNGRPIGEVNPGSGAIYYTHTDLLGTPQKLTDSTKATAWSALYRPFGDTQSTTGSIIQSLRFPGQQFDIETGYQNGGFRVYAPPITRYPMSDPIGLAGGINTYQYAEENPLGFVDLLGLDAELCTRPLQLPAPYARHCFLRYNHNDNDTSSYDPSGTHSDPKPAGAQCVPTRGDQDDDCLKREMNKCKGSEYDFTGHNCCHCAEDAMKACGQSIPVRDWPNWPINPGPQPEESQSPLRRPHTNTQK